MSCLAHESLTTSCAALQTQALQAFFGVHADSLVGVSMLDKCHFGASSQEVLPIHILEMRLALPCDCTFCGSVNGWQALELIKHQAEAKTSQTAFIDWLHHAACASGVGPEGTTGRLRTTLNPLLEHTVVTLLSLVHQKELVRICCLSTKRKFIKQTDRVTGRLSRHRTSLVGHRGPARYNIRYSAERYTARIWYTFSCTSRRRPVRPCQKP
jgi:hypothetical protein